MLVDLPANWASPFDPIMDVLADGRRTPKRLALGVYEAHLNFGIALRDLVLSEWPFMDAMRAHIRRNEEAFARGGELVQMPDLPSDFGVCDRWEQIVELWPVLAADEDHRYLIYVTPIVKAEQPSSGGWRWHKWGPYIGTHERTREYLYNEAAIEQVLVFSIVELKAEVDSGR